MAGAPGTPYSAVVGSSAPPHTRQALEAAVEAAIAALDAFDGDPDFEDGFDDEGYDGDREPDADAEPDLGWPTNGGQGVTLEAPPGALRDSLMGDYLAFDWDKD